MCGICGAYMSNKIVGQGLLKDMADALRHRGPDDEGYYVAGEIGLASRRLSIIDIDGGHQPISNEDGSIWIVCNGEIYNFKELRRGLEEKGHRFKTRTDTEVILHLYEEMGTKCIEPLNGMFAFAIWDFKKRMLFLARDRLGQKPLFYHFAGRDFMFASEVKGLLASGKIEREIDYEAVHHYLSLRFIPSPLTMFKAIKKLPPAHTMVVKDGSVSIKRYWDIDFTNKFSRSEDELIDDLDYMLSDSVKSHMISDVPVGAFLSGGMDTSTIVAYMAHSLSQGFKTFSIGVKEDDFNELPYARIVAERYSTEHIERVVEADLIGLLPEIIWYMDEPSDPIASCMFHAARLASEHVKVVLGGDGGDELFAGFDRYFGFAYVDYYNLLPFIIRDRIIGPLIRSIPDSFTYKSFTQRLRWLHQLSYHEDGDRYAEATSFFRFSHKDKKKLFGDRLWSVIKGIDSSEIIAREYRKTNAEDPVDRMLYADFMTRLPEHTLMLTDRMNMAHSLEARSPYLDHELVEFLAAFPSRLKIKGKNLKHILRKLARRYLPKEIINRKKQGFMFPLAYWMRSELYDFIKRQLKDSIFVKEGVFKGDYIDSLIQDHKSHRVDNHVRLWMLLNLEIWYRIYIDGHHPHSISEEIRGYFRDDIRFQSVGLI